MKETTTIEPFGEPDNPEIAYFEGAKRSLERLLDSFERFAENPRDAHGVAHLAEATQEYDKLFTLFGQEGAPFSYHWMERLRQRFSMAKAYYHRLLNNKGASPDYWLGRRIESELRGIEAAIEEMEQCIEWAGE